MDNEKVLELVNRIEAAMRELAEGTGEAHINCYVYDGDFSLQSTPNENGQTVLHFYKKKEA